MAHRGAPSQLARVDCWPTSYLHPTPACVARGALRLPGRSCAILRVALALCLFAFVAPSSKASEGQGVGAVLKEDGWSFRSSDGKEREYHLRAGTFFGFFSFSGGWGEHKAKNGYYRVAFFVDNEEKGMEKTTWLPKDKLEFFFYPCVAQESVGLFAMKKACIPIEGVGHKWTLEFMMSAQEKCKALGVQPPSGSVFVDEGAVNSPPSAEPIQTHADPPSDAIRASEAPVVEPTVLKNKDVLEMVRSGLAPEIVVLNIKTTAVDFDLSTVGLLELQNAHVPHEVIKTMLERPKGAPK